MSRQQPDESGHDVYLRALEVGNHRARKMPEHLLALEAMLDALALFGLYAQHWRTGSWHRLGWQVREDLLVAVGFFFLPPPGDGDPPELFHFEALCDILNLDPDAFRSALRRQYGATWLDLRERHADEVRHIMAKRRWADDWLDQSRRRNLRRRSGAAA